MGIRETLDGNSVLVVAVAVILLGVGGYLVYKYSSGSRPIIEGQAHFYDLNTREYFVGAAEDFPPIEAPSGPLAGTDNQPAGVRAYYFSCGACDESEWYLGYLSSLPLEVKQRQLETGKMQGGIQSMVMGQLIAAVPEDPSKIKWVGMLSPEGQAIVNRAKRACPDGSEPKLCAPQ